LKGAQRGETFLEGREDIVTKRQWGLKEEAQQRLGFIRQHPVKKTAPTGADLKFSRSFGAAQSVLENPGTMGLEVVTQSLAI
jgi:transposase